MIKKKSRSPNKNNHRIVMSVKIIHFCKHAQFFIKDNKNIVICITQDINIYILMLLFLYMCLCVYVLSRADFSNTLLS